MALYFCFGIVGIYLLRILFQKHDPFHPVTLIIAMNFLTLGISYTGIDSRWVGLSSFSWLVVISASVSLLLGQWTASLYTRSATLGANLHSDHMPLKYWNWTRYYWMLGVIFGLFTLGLLYHYSLSGGIPIFDSGADHMSRSSVVNLGVLNVYGLRGPEIFAISLLGAYPKWNPHRTGRWACILLSILIVVMSFSFYQSRFNLLSVLVTIAFYHHYFVKAINIKHLMILSLTMLGLFILVATLRMQYIGETTQLDIITILKLPYQYIANNWWNMDYAFNPPPHKYIANHPKWGYGLIEGIANLFPNGNAITDAGSWDSIFNESLEKYRGLNTVTWHWSAFMEFGYIGLTIVPFFVGVFLEYFFNSYKRKPNFQNLTVASITAGYFILSWFEEFYQNPMYLWRILFVWLVMKALVTNPWQTNKSLETK